MYSMVLMAAMLPSGDAAGFGKRSHGCNGCDGATAGCTGVVVAGCTGSGHSCNGSSCHGGGFLGLRNRNGCCGGGGGFLGLKHKSHSCHGGGCTGVVVSAGCSGGCSGTPVVVPAAPVTPAPEAMPPKK